MKIFSGITKNTINIFCSFCAAFVVCIVFSSVVFGISKGFQTNDSSLQPGMVVMLSPESNETTSTPTVERATEEGLQNILGVARTVEDSSITVASSGQTVFVEGDGEVRAYVSDINGRINQGDQLTISPLKGILSGANDSSKIILGTALEGFPSEGLQTRHIETLDGNKTTNIALMRVNLSTKLISGSQSDSALEKIGRSITGRDVSEIRVIVSLIVFLLVLFAEGGILYGSTSSAITSLGRNPLAGQIIRRQLIQVMFVAFGVLAVGLISVYLILLA